MSRTLVAYFSCSGITEKLARTLAEVVGGELYRIEPAVPYTDADLNWHNPQSRSSLEMRDKTSRPAISGRVADMEQYDTVYVGFPIWWYTAPTIVNTFLESYDFSGKTIILFATSGGSGLGKSAADLTPSASGAVIRDGKLLNGRQTRESLAAWVNSLSV